MSGDTRYAAFISYAHADETVAARLHKALETYPIPKTLRLAGQGQLSPIFRDAAELTAHHSLPEKIREAVDGSRFLIVLCSPAAKKSHWVNEEIRLFRKTHGEGSILCVLSEGNPETSFPPALLEGGREPLAANLGTTREGFRLGVTQLAASMLGVGLDQLIQRDSKRRRNRARLIMAGSLTFAALMGGMAFTAVNARDDAEVSRTEAEKMVEFILTDLKQDLEPVGRLNILDDVGNRVTEYYVAIPVSDMDDDRLARQARARHLLGQVAIDQGNMEKAQSEIQAAYQATKEVLQRNPNNTDAIFAHAQSAYWVGAVYLNLVKLDKVKAPWSEYDNLAQKLYASDPTNFDWIMEAAWGQNNLGIWARTHATKSKTQEAIGYYSQAITYFKEALIINPDSKSAQFELSDTLAGRASAELAFGTAERSRAFKLEQLKYLNHLIDQYPDDKILFAESLKAELDYYHDFFLDLSEIQEKEVTRLLGQLYDLTLHDPESLTYKLSFLYYSIEHILKMGLPSKTRLTSNISNIVSQLPDDLGGKKYYETMFNLTIKTQNDLDETKIFPAIFMRDTLDGYPEEKKWRITYLYFLQHKSPEIADTFLSTIEARSDVPFPTILDKQMRAHLELNNCSEVHSLFQSLQSRGFYSPRDIECRAPN